MARDDPNIETQVNGKPRYEAKTRKRKERNECQTGGIGGIEGVDGVEGRRTEETEDEEVKALSSKEEDEPQVMDGGKRTARLQLARKDCIDLNVLHEFWIEKRETHELCLIQVHHEQFVRGR